MAYRVMVQGYPVEVDTPDEVTKLISGLQQHQCKAESSTQLKSEHDSAPEISTSSISDEELSKRLMEMQGSVAAEILWVLCCSEKDVLSDTELKIGLGKDGDSNIGPKLASLTREVQRAGLEKEQVFLRTSKKGRKGKVFYWYKLTPQAKRVISELDDFNSPVNQNSLPPDMFDE